MTRFVVAGHATRSHAPERGTVRVAASVTSAVRSVASDDTIEVHNAVVAQAKRHAESGAATDWNAERVATSAFHEYVKDSDTTVLRYRARSSIEVVFHDFTVLADWVSSLAEVPGVEIEGIEWSLTTALRIRLEREVRVAAVKDAITKANDYAAGLERGSPSLDAVFEEGLRPNVGGGGGGFARDGMMMKAAAFDGASFELKPRDIEVQASISADFTM